MKDTNFAGAGTAPIDFALCAHVLLQKECVVDPSLYLGCCRQYYDSERQYVSHGLNE